MERQHGRRLRGHGVNNRGEKVTTEVNGDTAHVSMSLGVLKRERIILLIYYTEIFTGR